MERSDFLESMDACRETSDDLRSPELAPLADRLASDPAAKRLFDRVQRLDRRLSAATSDVPVPVGLAERIMACVESNSVEPGVVERAIDLEHDVETGTSAIHVAPARRRIGRRSWFLAATAACVLIAVAFDILAAPCGAYSTATSRKQRRLGDATLERTRQMELSSRSSTRVGRLSVASGDQCTSVALGGCQRRCRVESSRL